MSIKAIKIKVQAILNALDSPDVELSILLTEDTYISILNEKYRNKNRPTNVLAFAMQEGEFLEITTNLLGDVVISLETAEKESKEMNISMNLYLDKLLIHGILHLFGFDHEKSEEKALEMELKSQHILSMTEQIKETIV